MEKKDGTVVSLLLRLRSLLCFTVYLLMPKLLFLNILWLCNFFFFNGFFIYFIFGCSFITFFFLFPFLRMIFYYILCTCNSHECIIQSNGFMAPIRYRHVPKIIYTWHNIIERNSEL